MTQRSPRFSIRSFDAKVFGWVCPQCGPGGCLIELAEQLFIIMVGKQLINNIQEFILPYVKLWSLMND